jgi:hypothetical protein
LPVKPLFPLSAVPAQAGVTAANAKLKSTVSDAKMMSNATRILSAGRSFFRARHAAALSLADLSVDESAARSFSSAEASPAAGRSAPPPDPDVREFLDYVRFERGMSANTVSAYGRDLKRFAACLAG